MKNDRGAGCARQQAFTGTIKAMKVEQVHENKFEKERTTLRADEFGNVPGGGGDWTGEGGCAIGRSCR